MNALAGALLGTAGAAAIVDWAAVARSNKPLEYLSKPAVPALLAAVVLVLPNADPARRWLFVGALLFSLVGDAFLMLPSDRFVPGLASFLLGHIFYAVAFLTGRMETAVLAAAVPAVTVVSVVLARRVLASVDDRRLVAPLVAYAVAISAMLVTALATVNPLAMAGALLFYVSDLTIAWNRFVRRMPWAPLAIIVTYHLGQAGLVLSLA